MQRPRAHPQVVSVGDMGTDETSRHWEDVYAQGDERASWTQDRPEASLRAIAAAGAAPDAPIIDVGGGSSRLAAALLEAGHTDVSVLDISAAALELAMERLGPDAGRVTWIVADLLGWTPERRYGIWHDRAVLHFFTADAQRAEYAARVRACLDTGGHAVIATFAPDGPTTCSGLPVRRSSADDVLALLGAGFRAIGTHVEHHRTPGGRTQPFTWVVARREA